MKRKKLLLGAAKSLVSSCPVASNFLEFKELNKVSIIIYDKTEVSKRACEFLCAELKRSNYEEPMLYKLDSNFLSQEKIEDSRDTFIKPIIRTAMEEAGVLYRKKFKAAVVPEKMVVIASAAIIQKVPLTPVNWFCIEDFLNTDVFNFKPQSVYTSCGKLSVVNAMQIFVFDSCLNSILAGVSLCKALSKIRICEPAMRHIVEGYPRDRDYLNEYAADYIFESFGIERKDDIYCSSWREVNFSPYGSIIVVPEHLAKLVFEKNLGERCFYCVVPDDEDFTFSYQRQYLLEVNELAEYIDSKVEKYSAAQSELRRAMHLWYNLYSPGCGVPYWLHNAKNVLTFKFTQSALDKIVKSHRPVVDKFVSNLKL